MISEICPACEKNHWRLCEQKKFFVCANCNPEKIIEPDASEKKNEIQQQPLAGLEASHHCEHNDWWLPVGSDSTSRASQPRCWVCQPPLSRNLVGQKFFLDDAGNRWIIDQQPDGSEVWTKDDINVQQQH